MENVLRVQVAKTILGDELVAMIEDVKNISPIEYLKINEPTKLWEQIYEYETENAQGIIDAINEASTKINSLVAFYKKHENKIMTDAEILEIAREYIEEYYVLPTLDVGIDDNGYLYADNYGGGFCTINEYYFITEYIDAISYESIDKLNATKNKHINAYEKFLDNVDRYVDGNYEYAIDSFIEYVQDRDTDVMRKMNRGLGRILYDRLQRNDNHINILRDFLNLSIIDADTCADNFHRLVEILEL